MKPETKILKMRSASSDGTRTKSSRQRSAKRRMQRSDRIAHMKDGRKQS